jgi:hypothetical protein
MTTAPAMEEAGRPISAEQAADELAQRIIAVFTWSFDGLHEAMNSLAVRDAEAIDELAICIASEVEMTFNDLMNASRSAAEPCCAGRWVPVTELPPVAIHGGSYIILRDVPQPAPTSHRWIQANAIYDAGLQRFVTVTYNDQPYVYTHTRYYWDLPLPNSWPESDPPS